jgi:hypothetical protein
MIKYRPSVEWKESKRTLRAVCGLCEWSQTGCSLAIARAHVLAHPTHIVATVATITTLLSIADTPGDVVETPLTQDWREAERGQG